MNPRNPISVDRVIAQNVRPEERQIQIAGPRPAGVERRAILPAESRNRTAPHHGRVRLRHRLANHRAESLEPLPVAPEGQPDHILTHLRLRRDAPLRIVHGSIPYTPGATLRFRTFNSGTDGTFPNYSADHTPSK